MPIAMGLTDEEVQVIADAVLERQLKAFGFDHALARSGEDHDGEASLFVTAVLKPDMPVIHGEHFVRAHEALDEALRSRGERRFPYLRLGRPDESPDDDTADPE